MFSKNKLKEINKKAKEIRKKVKENNKETLPFGFSDIHLYNYNKGNNSDLINSIKKYGNKSNPYNDIWNFSILKIHKHYKVGYTLSVNCFTQSIEIKEKIHKKLLNYLEENFGLVGRVTHRLD